MPPSHGYPRTARLRSERDFATLRRLGGRRYTGREAVIRVVSVGGDGPRLGLATPKAYGHAVRRNRFRRLAREAFRHVRPELRPVDLLVVPRRDLREPTLDGLCTDLRAAAAAGRPPA